VRVGSLSTSPLRAVLLARGLRAFGDGFVSLLLPIYLLAVGLTPFEVGVIATGTLAGSGALTLFVGHHAHRFTFRMLLLGAAALMAATGIAFAASTSFWPLLVVAIVGTLNPSSGDVSVFLPLEHALLAKFAPERRRTAWFARYSLAGALCGAAGALMAGTPQFIARYAGSSMLAALQVMFALYAALGVAAALVYRNLPA
jgi:MFS family permease